MSDAPDAVVPPKEPVVLHVNHLPPPDIASASPPVPSPSPPVESDVRIPIRLHSIRTTSIAKSNHFLQCDPLVVIAVDNHPLLKTSIRPNSTSCAWDLSNLQDIQHVPHGLHLPTADSSSPFPTLEVPVSSLSSSKLQIHQEDFSRLKADDEMGGVQIPMEDIVTKSWKKEPKKSLVAAAAAAAAAAGTNPTPATAAAPAADGSATTSAAVAPAPAASASSSPETPAAVSADGFYPVTIDSSLLDRVTGRHLGELQLKVSVQLEPYLRYLVASQQGLNLLYSLTRQFMDTPSPDTPLRHILFHADSLKSFMEFIVRAAADKGSMDGERMRELVFPFIGKVLDVFKPESQFLDLLFANDSEIFATLFSLRKCIPLSYMGSNVAYAAYENILEQFQQLVERIALFLEPPPPPPVKTEEELAAEAAAEAAAAKRAALKEKKRRAAAIAAGLDPDDPEAGLGSSTARGSKKKKSGLLSNSSLPDPPAHLPSNLQFGIRTLDLLHDLFDIFHIRLAGFKKQLEMDWNNESKIAELVRCCETLYKIQAFVFRFGSWSLLPPPATPDTDATAAASASSSSSAAAPALDASVGVSASSNPAAKHRMGCEDVRHFFLKETGDANALWFQKLLVNGVKKSKETLAENKELSVKLIQHSEYFLKNYPVVAEKKVLGEKKSARKSTSGK